VNEKISLIHDTFTTEDIDALCTWLKSNHQLSQGPLVEKFEEVFAKQQNRKYSVFVNSGSSANFLVALALNYSDLIKNRKVVVPALSWVTSISPWMMLNFQSILCDADKETLGLDLEHLKRIIERDKPGIVFACDVLGFPNKYDELKKLCDDNEIVLCIDDCECQGSFYNGRLTGTYGLMSTYSFFFSHMSQAIEGGMITTDDLGLYNMLKMLRAHGWTRSNDPEFQKFCKEEYQIDDFNDRFTFYLPGMNLRSTEINAFLGIRQQERISEFLDHRRLCFGLYDAQIKNPYWKVKPDEKSIVSLFAYPIITDKREQLLKALNENNIECRPLISGSQGLQPYWIDAYGKTSLPFADTITLNGLYLPCHTGLGLEKVQFICDVVNKVLNDG
jgi:CDP-4-dehydro-6-deoxyglucose reductase, E1